MSVDDFKIKESIKSNRRDTIVCSSILLSLAPVLAFLWWYFLVLKDIPEYVALAIFLIAPFLGVSFLGLIYTTARFLNLKKKMQKRDDK
ncbi:MAG: hypothetical protein HGN29_11415 [Asgard group archaeon]|nr:hypothetical protein [Asgard group archaeon]